MATVLNNGKVDKKKADYPEGYLGGAYLAGPGRAPTPVAPLASFAPPLPVVSTNGTLDSAMVLVLDKDAKATADNNGVPELLSSIQPLLRSSQTKPAPSRVVSFRKLLGSSPSAVEEEEPEGQQDPPEPEDGSDNAHDDGTVFSVKLGDNDTALSCTDGVVIVNTRIEGICVRVELSPCVARSVLNVLAFNGEVSATPVALRDRSTLVVAGGVTEDIVSAVFPAAAETTTEQPEVDVKRPGVAAPSSGLKLVHHDPPSDEPQTSKTKVGDRSAFRPPATTSTAPAQPMLDVVEGGDTRTLRSPSPGEITEAREEIGSTALAPLPPGPPPGHTGWTPSDGEGSEIDRRRRRNARRKAKRRPTSPSRKGRKRKSTQTEK